MALYDIEVNICLGMSHCRAVCTDGSSKVELSDEEVNALVTLIREKGTTDVEEMGLEYSYPDLYKKLDDAYHNMAYKAEELHWLINGFENGYYEYDADKVIKYCEENCGYEFVPKIDNVPDNISPDFIAALLEDRKEDMYWKQRDFCKWLPDYLRSINIEDACDFMYNRMNAELEMDDVDYVVKIPQTIIDMAKRPAQMNMKYNNTIGVETLSRLERLDPKEMNLLTYSGPKDTCQGVEAGKLGNMAGGFHFELFGVKWRSTEHLYLCGEWSTEGDRSMEIQQYIRKMPSGVYAKRCSKGKYRMEIREDFASFHHQWMLWCVWQKCLLNKDFANLLRSVPEDVVIVEVVKNDPVWAAYPDESGLLVGCNGMGKVLTICKRCLHTGSQPEIDTDLLNRAAIYILGKKVEF